MFILPLIFKFSIRSEILRCTGTNLSLQKTEYSRDLGRHRNTRGTAADRGLRWSMDERRFVFPCVCHYSAVSAVVLITLSAAC